MPDPHVTIPDEEPVERYTVGATPDDTFDIPFTFFATTDVKVYDDGTLVSAADYTITGNSGTSGGFSGGTLVLDTAVSNTVITVRREVPATRTTDFPLSGPFDIASLNTQLDKVFAILQQHASTVEAGLDADLSAEAAAESATEAAEAAAEAVAAAAAITGDITIDRFDGTGAQTAFTLSQDPGSENNTQVFIGGVYQQKDTYSVSGTTLTFGAAPPSGTGNVEVVIGTSLAMGVPSNGTVSTDKLADNAVTLAKMATQAANTVLANATASTAVPTALAMGASTILARLASGNIVAATPAQIYTLLDATKPNLLINGDFQIDRRNSGGSTAISDDAYCFDRWYALTQTASVNASQLTLQDTNQPYAIRLTQNQASAQRMGLAQIVEARHSQALRGQSATLSARIQCSSSQAIRYAILEWTGSADSVTSDVVNNWASGTYTAGNFFLGSNLTIAGVGTITPSASTWTDLTALTASISTSCNNLIVFIWTEGTAAQNVTLDIGKAKLEDSSFATKFIPDQYTISLAKCQRFYHKQTIGYFWKAAGAGQADATQLNFPVQMRAAPTVAVTGGTTTNLASDSFNETDTFGTRYSMTSTASGDVSSYGRTFTAVAEL